MTKSSKKVHYTATIRITRVTIEEYEGIGIGRVDDRSSRTVGEVGSVTVRALDMEKLRERVKDHLLIIDDDPEIPLDDVHKGQTRG